MTARPGFLPRAAKVLVLTLFFLALLLIFDPSGLSQEDSLPTVRELAVLYSEPDLPAVVNSSQDFDGDGVRDIVGIELEPHESLLSEGLYDTTLTVESGRTGERLLAIPAKQGSRAYWYGDYDNNGTMDVFFKDGERWRVFGLVVE